MTDRLTWPEVHARAETGRRTAEAFLDRAPDRTVLLGPVVWQPSDGATGKVWRFFAHTSTPDGGAPVGKFGEPDEAMAELLERMMRAAFMNLRPAVAIVTFDDELEMIEAVAKRWPCERAFGLLDDVKAARARLAERGIPLRSLRADERTDDETLN